MLTNFLQGIQNCNYILLCCAT